MSMPIILSTPLLRIKPDHRIDPHDRDTRLDCTLQLFILAHCRLQHACFDLIHNTTFAQVKPVIAVILPPGDALLVLIVAAATGGAVVAAVEKVVGALVAATVVFVVSSAALV